MYKMSVGEKRGINSPPPPLYLFLSLSPSLPLSLQSMAMYWLSSSLVGLGHNLLLRSPRFRRLCCIPATRGDSDTPYRDLAAAAVSKYLK